MTADAADRPPIWESHIRPMFRTIDVEHMKPMVDLGSYDAVKAKANAIVTQFSRMPPASTGGPWPEEWKALFKRWIATGFRRLELATPQAPGYTLEQSFEGWRLSALARVPNQGYQAWLEIVSITADRRTYMLYAEAPASGGGPPAVKPVEDEFDRGTAQFVVITDAQGTHRVPFPA